MVAMPEFQAGQRVRVREAGGEEEQPDQSLLGKEGTIQSVTGNTHRAPSGFYFVKFDDSVVIFAISPDWLVPR